MAYLYSMQALIDYLNGFGPVSEANMAFLIKYIEEKTLKKGEHLINLGQPVNSMYCIEEGYVHCFALNEEGERLTRRIEGPISCWTVLESFYDLEPSPVECIALSPVKYFELSRAGYDAIKAENEELNGLITRITERLLSDKLIATMKFSSMTPEERYLDMVENQPDVVKVAPVQALASFMGISRETLHRIRRKLITS